MKDPAPLVYTEPPPKRQFSGSSSSEKFTVGSLCSLGALQCISWLQVAHGVGQCAVIRAIPGLTKEKFLNIVWSTLLMSAPSAYDSRGFSLINSLSKLLQSLGDACKGGREIFHYINVLVDLLCLFSHVVKLIWN